MQASNRARLLSLLAAAALAAAPAIAQKSHGQRIGDVTLDTSADSRMVVDQLPQRGAYDFDIHGSRVSLTSARYDIASPHIQVLLRAGVVQTGTATGNVEVHLRDPDAGQSDTLTCSKAIYTGATGGQAAHMRLTGANGGVHYVMKTPQTVGPVDLICDGAEVTFLPGGHNKIALDGLHGTGTPIEPPATPKKTASGK
jgi:hypothetical protein